MKEQLHSLSSSITRAVKLHPGLIQTHQAGSPYLQEQYLETFYILQKNMSFFQSGFNLKWAVVTKRLGTQGCYVKDEV